VGDLLVHVPDSFEPCLVDDIPDAPHPELDIGFGKVLVKDLHLLQNLLGAKAVDIGFAPSSQTRVLGAQLRVWGMRLT
jgi:hypothetical protein